MQTLRDIAPYVALGAAVLAVVLLVLVLVLWSTVRRLRRSQSIVLGHHEERDIVAHVVDLDSQVRNLREAVEILTDQLDEHKRHLDHALTNRAIVRYDAFRDAGGEQSASFALLDNHRSGVVFSAIAARDFARIYVKHLSDGVADRDLSPEEQQAVAAGRAAAAGGRRGWPAQRARPRAGRSRPADARRARRERRSRRRRACCRGRRRWTNRRAPSRRWRTSRTVPQPNGRPRRTSPGRPAAGGRAAGPRPAAPVDHDPPAAGGADTPPAATSAPALTAPVLSSRPPVW